MDGSFLTNPHWIFATTVVMFLAFVFVIRRYGTVLMGFTMFAALNIFIQNLSFFTINYAFRLPNPGFASQHYYVYAYMAFGLLAFAAGVWLAWRPLRRGFQMSNPFVAEPKLIFVFIAIGTVFVVTDGLLPRIPTVSAVLFRLSQFLHIGILGAFLYSVAAKKPAAAVASVMVLLPVGLFHMLLSGQAWLLGAFLLHPVLLILFWRRPSWWRFPVFAVWLYAFFVMGGIWLQSRTLIREGKLEGSALDKASQFLPVVGWRLSDPITYSPLAVQWASGSRLDLSVFLAAQAEWMPDGEPFSHGRSLFIDPIYAVIPRLFWKDKPTTLGGNEFINRFTGMNFSQDSISVDTNIVFELYANYAIPGVIVGLLVFGYVMARMELALFRPGQTLTRVMMLCAGLFICSAGGRRAAYMAMEIGASVAAAWLLSKALTWSGLFRHRLRIAQPGAAVVVAEAQPSAPAPAVTVKHW